jgi:hypothetical protein
MSLVLPDRTQNHGRPRLGLNHGRPRLGPGPPGLSHALLSRRHGPPGQRHGPLSRRRDRAGQRRNPLSRRRDRAGLRQGQVRSRGILDRVRASQDGGFVRRGAMDDFRAWTGCQGGVRRRSTRPIQPWTLWSKRIPIEQTQHQQIRRGRHLRLAGRTRPLGRADRARRRGTGQTLRERPRRQKGPRLREILRRQQRPGRGRRNQRRGRRQRGRRS